MRENCETTRLYVAGMTCAGCEGILENALKETPGVLAAKANFGGGYIDVFHEGDVSAETLSQSVENAGDYSVTTGERKSSGGLRAIIPVSAALIVFFALRYFGVDPALVPMIDSSAGLGFLFVIGLTTSLHCVGMCGGIQIAQCTRAPSGERALIPAFLYNSGRVVSYTLLGGIIGMAGSVLSFSPRVQGGIMLVAAFFMALMGLNSLLPDMVRFRFALPSTLSTLRNRLSNGRGAFVIGMLNGLMPCGPLQAMQLYALGTGSFIGGASAMFAFSLGTVPLMFGLGAASSLLTRKFRGIMKVAGGGLLLVLALFMARNGLALAGFAGFCTFDGRGKDAAFVDFSSSPSSPAVSSVQTAEASERLVVVEVSNRGYATVSIPVGVPVKLVFRATARSLNGCNNAIVIPSLNLRLRLRPGDTATPVFMADAPGRILYSCWMGMIPGIINVVEQGDLPPSSVEKFPVTPFGPRVDAVPRE